MSYDIWLKSPVTGRTLELDEPHYMRGGMYAVGGTKELWLNITYNYSHYYYEATDGDARFAHDSEGETEYGIRGIYGKTGAESVPMLQDMIKRIESKHRVDGEWLTKKVKRVQYTDSNGRVMDLYHAIVSPDKCEKKEYEEVISEGPCDDYWEETAGNAISPLYQLIAMAKLRPDGIWDGD